MESLHTTVSIIAAKASDSVIAISWVAFFSDLEAHIMHIIHCLAFLTESCMYS